MMNNKLTDEQIRVRIKALKNAAGDSLCSTYAADARLLEELLASRAELQECRKEVKSLEVQIDNAHAALQAVLDSGEVQQEFAVEMVRRGLNNEPQPKRIKRNRLNGVQNG